MKTQRAKLMADLRARRKEAGIVKVEVWVSSENAHIVRKVAYKLNNRKPR